MLVWTNEWPGGKSFRDPILLGQFHYFAFIVPKCQIKQFIGRLLHCSISVLIFCIQFDNANDHLDRAVLSDSKLTNFKWETTRKSTTNTGRTIGTMRTQTHVLTGIRRIVDTFLSTVATKFLGTTRSRMLRDEIELDRTAWAVGDSIGWL